MLTLYPWFFSRFSLCSRNNAIFICINIGLIKFTGHFALPRFIFTTRFPLRKRQRETDSQNDKIYCFFQTIPPVRTSVVINLQLLFLRITEVFVPEHKLYNLELETYSVRNFKTTFAVFIKPINEYWNKMKSPWRYKRTNCNPTKSGNLPAVTP